MTSTIPPIAARLTRHAFTAAAVLSLLVLAVGCGCKPRTNVKALQVTISRAESLEDKLVSVSLFAARDNEIAKWRGPQAEPASTLTRESAMGETVESAIKRIVFTVDGPNSIVITRNDPIWSLWRGREGWTVVAVADTETVGDGSATRRPAFSIDACDWEKKVAVIELKVDERGIAFTGESADRGEGGD